MFNKRGALSKVELSKEQHSKIRFDIASSSQSASVLLTHVQYTHRERERIVRLRRNQKVVRTEEAATTSTLLFFANCPVQYRPTRRVFLKKAIQTIFEVIKHNSD